MSTLAKKWKSNLFTEEWLVRFGFELKYGSNENGNSEYKNQEVSFTFHKWNPIHQGVKYKYTSEVIKCEYVHQLQNLLFALTGEELKTE